MAQQSIEERLASLEKESADRLASLEREVKELKQELAKRRTLEGLRADVQELQVRYQAHEEYVSDRLNELEGHLTTRMDVLEDNQNTRFQELQNGQQELQTGQQELQAGLTGLAGEAQGLAAGQQQILDLLRSKPRTND
jgi:chromosome segregation ATPase